MKALLKVTLLFILFITIQLPAFSQCAMCRATVENNLSSGELTVGAGLNVGILYLFVMPYLIAAVIGFFWYRNAKMRKKKFQFQGEKF